MKFSRRAGNVASVATLTLVSALGAAGALAGTSLEAAGPGPATLGSTAPGAPAPGALAPGATPPSSAAPPTVSRPAVLSTRVIGHSVNGHPIRAWELGDRDADITAVAIGAQHGNEVAGQTVLASLRDGDPVVGVHLWVVPRANPDGVSRGTRQNAHGVDLNRNFPHHWKRLTGYYDSGPRPASERETRTMMRFLTNVKPDLAVSFHTPLYGLDVTGAKDRPFARRLSEELKLPDKRLQCSGRCHGTLSQWFNHRRDGALVTVEFGSSPRSRYLHVRAPRGLARAFGGHLTHPAPRPAPAT